MIIQNSTLALWAYLSIKPPALLCNFAEGTDEITGNQAKTPDKILQGTKPGWNQNSNQVGQRKMEG